MEFSHHRCIIDAFSPETYYVGEVSEETRHLVQTSYESLFKGIEMVRPKELYRNVGNAVSKHCSQNKCSVVRTYTGHGINSLFHTAPNVPHYAKNKAVGMMHPGQTFTIEPMVNAGASKDFTWPDDWTAVSQDGSRSAQFEHTMLVTETGVELLTARLPTSRRDVTTALPRNVGGRAGPGCERRDLRSEARAGENRAESLWADGGSGRGGAGAAAGGAGAAGSGGAGAAGGGARAFAFARAADGGG